jgi:hypothetical protein
LKVSRGMNASTSIASSQCPVSLGVVGWCERTPAVTPAPLSTPQRISTSTASP